MISCGSTIFVTFARRRARPCPSAEPQVVASDIELYRSSKLTLKKSPFPKMAKYLSMKNLLCLSNFNVYLLYSLLPYMLSHQLKFTMSDV